MMGVAALQEWCRRELDDYPGVRIRDMSSSWRDGLAFCALIHRYRPHLIDFHSLDTRDWRGNCLLAFTLAEEELGIPQLLDTDYVVRSASPDQFFIMTYVAQFYHKFSIPDSGYDSTSGLTTSFKYSSSEEDNTGSLGLRHKERIENTGKRRGVSNSNDWKRKRPIGLVVSGGLELRLDTPPEAGVGRGQRLYDADDEECEAGEVILSKSSGPGPEVRNGNIPHQDLVLKRKRPNSLNRVSPMDKENVRRPGKKTTLKPGVSKEGVGSKRRIIGVSDYPKPYKSEHKVYLGEKKREHSVESEDNSSLADPPTSVSERPHSSLRERLREVPSHIAESQRLLKTSILQMPEPQYPKKCLILNIYKIKHQQVEDKSTSPPPIEFSIKEKTVETKNQNQQTSLQEIDHLSKFENLSSDISRISDIPKGERRQSKAVKRKSPVIEEKEFSKVDGNADKPETKSTYIVPEVKLNSSLDILNEPERRDKRNSMPLTKNVLRKEKDNNLFTQLTQKEKIEKYLSKEQRTEQGKRLSNKLIHEAEDIPAESLTPRSKSKFEHLIRNLKESNEDEQLVVYKMMEVDTGKRIKITDFVPYKGEPKDKYTVEFLWNIGAANYVGSGRRAQGHGRHKRRRRY